MSKPKIVIFEILNSSINMVYSSISIPRIMVLVRLVSNVEIGESFAGASGISEQNRSASALRLQGNNQPSSLPFIDSIGQVYARMAMEICSKKFSN